MPSHSVDWQGSVRSRGGGGTARSLRLDSSSAAHSRTASQSVPSSPYVGSGPGAGGFGLALATSPLPTPTPTPTERTWLVPRSASAVATAHMQDGSGESDAGGGGGWGRRISRQSSRLWQSFSIPGTPRWVDGRSPAKERAGYDTEFQEELAGEAGIGMRVWYDTMTSIDWLHDLVKDSMRKRRLLALPGYRGALRRGWNRIQGWLLVTLIGLTVAVFAAGIVRIEMWLFDLKEGYCTAGWTRPKRFCCEAPKKPQFFADFALLPMTNFSLSPSHQAFSPTSFISGWSASPRGQDIQCSAWRTWSEVLTGKYGGEGAEGDDPLLDWLSWLVVALVFALASASMTVYLTSSENVSSSKHFYQTRAMPDRGAQYPAVHKSESPSILAPQTPLNEEGESSASSGAAFPIVAEAEVAQEAPHWRPRKVIYFAAGSGIPELKTILSGFVIRGYLGSWTLLTKSLGLALSVASGLTLGKEGPLVHVSSCIGNLYTRLFRKYDLNEAKRREVLSAACAAGVAVAFGAPLGGVLFSLEEVSYFFPPRVMWRSFWCAMVAAATLKMLNPFGTGKTVLFEVTFDRDWHFVELLGFLLLGLVGGVVGAYFAVANVWWSQHVRNGSWIKRHPIVEVLLVTALTALVGFFNPWLKMSGTELVYEMFAECKDREGPVSRLCISKPSQVGPLVASVAVAIILKWLLTVITFGIKVPAGIFIPSLGIGAGIGRVAGLAIEYWYSAHPKAAVFDVCRAVHFENVPFGNACVLPGVWAMVGAAAVLAGVTRTTVSLAVIVMELTGSLVYVLPIMLAVLVAKTCADAIESRDLVIEASDLPFLDAKADYVHNATPTDIMDPDVPTIVLNSTGNTISFIRSQVDDLYASGSAGGFPIVVKTGGDDDHEALPRVYGYIGVNELDHALSGRPESAEDDDDVCVFAPSPIVGGRLAVDADALDLSHLVDHAPVTVSARAPMVFVHELFVKLGIRYLIVQDEMGLYRGVIEKNRWLRYLSWIEGRHKHSSAPAPSPSPSEA